MAEITDRKTSKLVRRGSKRPLKNFLWWLFGVFSALLIFTGATAIAVCLIPMRTYMGNRADEFVNDEVASGTVLNFFMNYQNWKVGDLPVLRRALEAALKNSPLSNYFELDYNGIDGLGYKDFTTPGFDITQYVTITATINSLVGDLGVDLGNFADFAPFADWTKVTDAIDPDDPDFAPQLYFYRVDESVAYANYPMPNYAFHFKTKETIEGSDGHTYAHAYDEEGNLKEEARGKDLYMPALLDVPLTEMMSLMQPRIMLAPATSLLELGGITDGIIRDMLEGYTIKGLSDFDTNTIKLHLVMPNDEAHETLYTILKGATGKDANEITIGDLADNFETDRIEISSILQGDNEALYDIIRSAKGLPADHIVTVGDLNDLDIKKVDLTAVIEETEDTADLYDILRAVTGKDTIDPETGEYPAITISDLEKPLVYDNIKLTTVLKEDGSEDLYDILKDATNTPNADDITIGSLSGDNFSTDGIRISNIIPDNEDNEQLYDLLEAATDKTSENITLGDLDGMDLTKAKISTLMDSPSDTLKSILVDGCSTISAGYHQIDVAIGDDSAKIVEATCPAIDNEDESYLLNGEATYDAIHYEVTFDLQAGGTGTFTVTADSAVMEQAEVIWEKEDESLHVATTTIPVKDYHGKFHATAYSEKPYEDITVDEMNNFNVNNIHLSTVISNESTLNIIVSATGIEADDLRLRDLTSSFNIDHAKISDVLDLHYDEDHPDQKTFIRILVSACYSGDETFDGMTEDEEIVAKYELLTIGDINNFVIDDVALYDVIPFEDNETLYKILADANDLPHTEETYKSFKIGTINDGIDFDKVRLTSVLDETTENEKMFDILRDGAGVATNDEITIGSLNTLDINSVHLTSIIDEDAGDGKLFAILKDATGAASNADITVGSLDTMQFDNVHLTSIIDDDDDHKTILDILCAACSTDRENLTIGSLDTFEPGLIKISDVLDPTDPANDKIYDILLDATAQSAKTDITINMLSGDNFDIGKVQLSHALSPADTDGNEILDALLADDTVTIGNLGSKINDISLFKAYGSTVFTKSTDPNDRAVNDKYVKSVVAGKEVYTYSPLADDPTDENNVYYVSKTANIWLLFCFDTSNVNPTNGRIETYTESEVTFAQLVDGSITSRITETTIYNLIASGMIEDDAYPDTLKARSIQDVIDLARYL